MVKGSKFLNPADKARKEARKKELKKNKKQRLQVRSAAIERKDPEQVIADLEKLDRFEFDTATNPTMNDNFYKDKRKRLKETLNKILAYYLKEDPDKHSKLKKQESDYEIKHKKLAREFEAIKAAQELKIEDIFLPPEPDSLIDEIADDDSLLSESVYVTPLTEGIKPPGCPPGLPPDFKQLVDNLRTSFTVTMPPEPQPLPPNLINLRLPQTTIPDSTIKASYQPYRNRSRTDYNNTDYNKNGQQYPKQVRNSNCKRLDGNTIDSGAAKTAVIESKPVLFKPKTTKFVPSSVRSKLTRNEPKG